MHDEAQCPHVHGICVIVAQTEARREQSELLWSHVTCGADARAQVCSDGGLGDAEVCELDLDRDE